MNKGPAWGRLALGVAGVMLLAYLLYLGPADHPTSDVALIILGTALSILAGILLAIITMLGNPRSLYPGSWRVASAHRREIRYALNRSAMLFSIYLSVIATAFGAHLIEAYAGPEVDVRWVKHIALSVGSMALLWSFSLPWVIREAQLVRLDDEVESRKRRTRESSNNPDDEISVE